MWWWCSFLKAEVQFHEGSLHNSKISHASQEEIVDSPLKLEDKLPRINVNSKNRKQNKKKLMLKSSRTDSEVADSFVPLPSRRSPHRGDVVNMRKSMSNSGLNTVTIPPKEQLRIIKESRTSYELALEDLIRQKFTEIVQRRSLTVASNSKSRYCRGFHFYHRIA